MLYSSPLATAQERIYSSCPEITKTWGHNAYLKDSNIIWKIHPLLMHEAHLWCAFKQIIVDGVDAHRLEIIPST